MPITKIEWTSTVLDDGTLLPGYSFNPWVGCTKARSIHEQCNAYHVPFFGKQLDKVRELPHDLMVRQFPRSLRFAGVA